MGQMQEYAASSDFAKERKTMLAEVMYWDSLSRLSCLALLRVSFYRE